MNTDSSITQIPKATPATAIFTIGTDTEPECFPRSILRAMNNSKFKSTYSIVPSKIIKIPGINEQNPYLSLSGNDINLLNQKLKYINSRFSSINFRIIVSKCK